MPADLGATMVNEKTKGERIKIRIRVIDGAGAPLKDALVEIWQADAAGLYNSPSDLRGAGRPAFCRLGPPGDRHGRPANASSRRSSPAACRSSTAA